jgi:molybdopterin-binding protein
MLLTARGVTQLRGTFRLVVDELAVDRGEVLAVLGPNGAGKSTLFRLLALLDVPASGEIMLDGHLATPGNHDARRQIAAVFQRPHLFAGSVRDNVEFGIRVRGAGSGVTARAEAWLDAFGIADLADVDVRQISGGEAQRAALARAFAVSPDLLLLDEPAAALDALASRRLLSDLERMVHDERRGVVIVTHDPAQAFALADRVLLLEDGRVRQVGTPAELVAEPATPYAAAIAGAELMLGGTVIAVDDALVAVELAAGGRILVDRSRAAAATVGAPIHLAYRPEDVVLAAPGGLTATSLANRFDVRVHAVRETGGSQVRVRVHGPPDLVALVTRQSAAALGITPGTVLEAALKATALRGF